MLINNKKKWITLSSKSIFDSPFVKMRSEELLLPNSKVMPRYYIMDFTDWVNIVPITTDGKVVLISQYRHAAATALIEIPGGAVDMRTVESTEDAAKRELLEETGYSPAKVEFLGWQYPNPAYQSNKLWTYLALGCELIQNQSLDEFEDIDVILAEPQKVIAMIKKGEITHSLVLSSLLLALEHLKP